MNRLFSVVLFWKCPGQSVERRGFHRSRVKLYTYYTYISDISYISLTILTYTCVIVSPFSATDCRRCKLPDTHTKKTIPNIFTRATHKWNKKKNIEEKTANGTYEEKKKKKKKLPKEKKGNTFFFNITKRRKTNWMKSTGYQKCRLILRRFLIISRFQ